MEGIPIGRIRGILIQVHWSVLVIVWLLVWSLATVAYPDATDDYRTAEYWVVAGISAVVFLAGLVAHEVGHSLVARNYGIRVERISLWMFGGVAMLGSEMPSPHAERRVALAGPAVSGLIGAACLSIAVVLVALTSATLAIVSLVWLGTMNLLLAAFNLLPAFPLDGGRVYRARVWAETGDLRTATVRAAERSLAVGMGLIVLGVLQVLFGLLIGGLWMAMIGWFIRDAARAEVARLDVQQTIVRHRVNDVMTAAPICVSPTLPVVHFVEDYLLTQRHPAYPVVDADGRFLGLATLAAVRGLPRPQWEQATVADLMTPADEVPTIGPDASIEALARGLGPREQTRAVVVAEDGRPVGIVAPSDVARLLAVAVLEG